MQEQSNPLDVPTTSIIVIITTSSPEERREMCAWCWPRRNPGKPYPEEWSSIVCEDCDAAMSAQIAQAKARVRAAREARQAALLAAVVTDPSYQQRQEQCIWCWYEQHPGEPYPFGTSSMCVPHKGRQRAVLAASRAQKRQEVIAV